MAHCAVIRRFVSIWRRGLPLQRPDIPHHKHQNPSEGVEDAIDREFNDLFDQWRKLTNEILSEPTERYEIGESVLLGKAISYPAQVNSVIGVYTSFLCNFSALSFEIVGILHFFCHIRRIGSDIGCSRSQWNNGLFCCRFFLLKSSPGSCLAVATEGKCQRFQN